MDRVGCKFCKYRYDETEHFEDFIGCDHYHKVSYCKKYENVITRFHFNSSLFAKTQQQVINDETCGILCDNFQRAPK